MSWARVATVAAMIMIVASLLGGQAMRRWYSCLLFTLEFTFALSGAFLLSSCGTYYCESHPGTPHASGCYFSEERRRGVAYAYGRHGLLPDLYYGRGCSGDGLSEKGCKEH